MPTPSAPVLFASSETMTALSAASLPELIKHLNNPLLPLDKGFILKQWRDGGMNALIISAYHDDGSFPALLHIISTLRVEDKAIIFQQSEHQANNVFMVLARLNPDYLPAFLEAINTLNTHDKLALIKQVSETDKTDLIDVIFRSPKAIVAWTNIVIVSEDTSLLLCNKKTLPLIAKHAPESVLLLLPLIAKLTFKEQKHFFSGRTPIEFARAHIKRLNRNHQARNAFGHAQTQYQLKKLADKINDLDIRIGYQQNIKASKARNVVKKLYDTLQTSYEQYLFTETPQARAVSKEGALPSYDEIDTHSLTLEGLQTIWREAINEATPTLSTHRGGKEIGFKSGIAIVLPFYWLGNAMAGNSFSFFPDPPLTDSMVCVKDIEKALAAEIVFHPL